MGKSVEYLLLFVLTGLSAVLMKYLAEANAARWTGLVATFPIRIGIGLFLVSEAAGLSGLRRGTTGTIIGLVAIMVMIGVTHLLARSIGVRPALGVGMAVWFVAAYGLGQIFRG
ncbi:MAG: hypothetical protein H6807_03825 [Planctomycetes bacterium]|nr:hypothetical protein [Planctomycetota bacterium]